MQKERKDGEEKVRCFNRERGGGGVAGGEGRIQEQKKRGCNESDRDLHRGS